ncbi:uncharacterized protein N7479_001567 [Penicillium vulpinum]|uniref:Uncharacterized protein n=1 Tax=Penicillium vulpinum TaxID=29845 RepID=A0A1V6RUZ1_9EURO|nr:uncharacterized protein N7479_001567 [Penicillium vulpinum]KAJ5971649.1 hypothetical protein N7479_001567 [Penicillium vulpinum]OQE05408.1 hypothetical protein PENVUL_c024G04092 [Penicillium vulpinum]
MASSNRRDFPRSRPYSQEPSARTIPLKNITILPCQRGDKIFKMWDGVRDEIVKRIDLTHVFAVGCYRMETVDNPRRAPPTIIVSGRHTRHLNTSKSTTDTINAILKRHGLSEVRVEFLEGRYSRNTSDEESGDEPESKRDVDETRPGKFYHDVVRLRSMPGQNLALKENSST